MTEVGGYRVLRTAARGTRCRLVVGHHDGVTVVLKIANAGDPAVAREAEALCRGAGEHVVALLDAAADERESVLVLERLGGGTLGDVLERRGALGAGEVVTLLAPLAATLDRLHGAGVAHGDLSIEAVCLTDDGAPTLVGFGRAELFAAGSPEVVREAIPGVVADRAALRGMAALLLARVTGPRADAARRLAASLDHVAPAALAAALFDLAVPEVVATDADAADWRVIEPQDPPAPTEPDPPVPPWLIAFVPDPLRERLTESAVRLRGLWVGWTAARRRLVLGGAAALLTTAVVLVLTPTPQTEAAAPPASAPVAEAEEPSLLPDDPADAAAVLLAERERCLRDLSVLCLDAVDQPGSAAYDEDAALIAAIGSGAETPVGAVAAGDPELVERLGDSALVRLPAGSEPGSLLLMNTDAGWRIRDYFPAVPGAPSG